MQEIRQHVPLAEKTTFQIGGSARYFVDVRSDAEIGEAIAWARQKNLPFFVTSGGSNLLIPDSGLEGLVIHLAGDLYSAKEGLVDSWAGTNLLALIRAQGTQGWGGWEKLAGIPGTIGGAVRGNAGAFGAEIKDFVVQVRASNAQTGETREFEKGECGFAYRHSFFKNHPQWIIVRALVQLRSIDPNESTALAEETIAEREKRHLQNVRAAGSYFMNPVAPAHIIKMFEEEKKVKSRENRVPAGWLIERAGMKGARVGGAQASLQHPNYIVNASGTATAADVLALATKIKNEVKLKFDIELKEEAAVFYTK